jgi:hypothetical protein
MGDMKKINYILINGRKKAGLTQAELDNGSVAHGIRSFA